MFDVQVQILDLLPRPNPQNESYGITTAGNIGWWNRTGYSTPGYKPTRAGAVVYKVSLAFSVIITEVCMALNVNVGVSVPQQTGLSH